MYSITANVWTRITVTIPGDTGGTWVAGTNAGAMYLIFTLGAGSNYLAPANAWVGSYATGATGSYSMVGTLGATWSISNIQLEKGSTATPFEFRHYGQELALCQRYYWQDPNGVGGTGFINTTTTAQTVNISFPTTMRVSPPSVTYVSAGGIDSNTSSLTTTGASYMHSSLTSAEIGITTAASLGTAGMACIVRNLVVGFSAEL